MPRFLSTFEIKGTLEAVRSFHSDPRALRLLTPFPVVVTIQRFGPLADGMQAQFTLWFGPFPLRWTALHFDVGPAGFTDVQLKGPLKSWRHRHEFIELFQGRVEIRDEVVYEYPDGVRGWLSRLLFSPLALRLLFLFRARATRRALRSA